MTLANQQLLIAWELAADKAWQREEQKVHTRHSTELRVTTLSDSEVDDALGPFRLPFVASSRIC